MDKIHWEITGQVDDSTVRVLEKAARKIDAWLNSSVDDELDALGRLTDAAGGITWKPSSIFWRKLGFHHVEFGTVYIDPQALNWETAIHEFAHVLDNALGAHPLATIFGGGPADDMARYLGYEPEKFFPRFRTVNFEQTLRNLNIERNPSSYGRQNGPAEDFAESFRLAVTQTDFLKEAAPRRFAWLEQWKISLTGLSHI